MKALRKVYCGKMQKKQRGNKPIRVKDKLPEYLNICRLWIVGETFLLTLIFFSEQSNNSCNAFGDSSKDSLNTSDNLRHSEHNENNGK